MISSKPNSPAPSGGEKRKELAKQGNARAIAVLMNRWLQPKGIIAAAKREDSCLQLTIEAERVPNQTVLIAFIRKVLASVEVVSIQTVKISVHLTGESESVWQEEIQLTPQSEAPEATTVAVAPFSVSEEIASEESIPLALEETPSIAIAAAEIAHPIEAERQEFGEFVFDEMPPEEISYSPQEKLEIVEFSSDEMPIKETVSEESGETASQDEIEVVAQSKLLSWLSTPRGKLLAIVSLAVVVLGIVGINAYLQQLSPIEPPPTPAPSPTKSTATPTALPNPGAKAPENLPGDNPFKQAIELAIATANRTQTAKSKDNWQGVANQWQEAIARMQAVPQSSPNYQLAQQKLGEYQRNLDYALQKVATNR